MKTKSLLLGGSLLLTALSSISSVNAALALRWAGSELSTHTSAALRAVRQASPMIKAYPASLRFVSTVASPSAYKVTLMPGDGIGSEVALAVQRVVAAAGVPVEWDVCEAGAETFKKGDNTGVPLATIESIQRNKVALKGPLETPVGHGGKSANVTLRKLFRTYGNIRPVQRIPGIKGPYEGTPIDFIVVRENAEDLYTGIEHMQTPEVAQTLKLISRAGCERIVRLAFAIAEAEGRSKVTCATKANIMKLSEGMMKRVFEEVAGEFPSIKSEHMIVDNCAHQMVKKPQQFDVVVMTNMNGDILSDEASALVGGLGIAPGVNYGDEVAIFEAVHGSAPDIAGQNKANPTAMLLSSVMMLRHLAEYDAADTIENALYVTIGNGKFLTGDIAWNGSVGTTTQFTDEVIRNLGKHHPEWVKRSHRKLEVTPIRRPISIPNQETVGVDIFIHSPMPASELGPTLHHMAERVGLNMKMIGDLGLQVYPSVGGVSSEGSSHYQCRFVDSTERLSETKILELLKAISARYQWTQVERLLSIEGKPAYTKIQGEA